MGVFELVLLFLLFDAFMDIDVCILVFTYLVFPSFKMCCFTSGRYFICLLTAVWQECLKCMLLLRGCVGFCSCYSFVFEEGY